jgi:adenylyl-sulfate kinase
MAADGHRPTAADGHRPTAADGHRLTAADGPQPTAAGATVWLTGLPGSGKSTIAGALVPLLAGGGHRPLLLDGDDLREGLNADLGFSPEDRAENVRRVGEVALLLARNGLVALAPVISPYNAGRARIRSRHEAAGVAFLEVHVATRIEECERRDVKGHYAAARRGELKAFTGVSDPYEAPERPELVIDTAGRSVGECADAVLAALHALLGRKSAPATL